jgi:hypothetical protein
MKEGGADFPSFFYPSYIACERTVCVGSLVEASLKIQVCHAGLVGFLPDRMRHVAAGGNKS